MSNDPPNEATGDEVYDLDPEEELDENRERLVQEAVAAVERSANPGEASESAPAVDEYEALRERHLRTLADFENYRRRSERERRESARRAQAEPLREFLGVIDNLDRALGAEGDAADVRAGVEMILKQMREVLKRFGVEEIPAEGTPFDPSVHEAVLRFEDAAATHQTVTEVLQKGYVLDDRLLRPSMVKVAVPPAGSGDAPARDD